MSNNEFDWEAFWVWIQEYTKKHRVIQPNEYSQVYPMDEFLRLMRAEFQFDPEDVN